MTKGKPTTKKPVKASSRASSTTKASKKSIVSGGGRKKQGFFATVTSKQWLVIGLIVVVVFGGLGTWKLVTSHADTTALSSRQCYNRGRVFASYNTCRSACLSGAGSYITANVEYAYCSNAQSTSVSSTYCVNTLHREYNSGSGGCARRWNGTFGNTFTNAYQCYNDSWTYVMASPYDYCKAPTSGSTTPTPSTTGWANPVSGTFSLNQGYSTSKPHYGIDIRASVGTAVKAVNSGSINWAGNIGYGCGNGMILKTTSAGGATVYAVYQHMNPVKYSGSFSKGDTVGYVQNVGVTSCWTGAHLHFGVQNTGGTIWSPTNYDRAGYFYNPCSYVSGC